jgi:competence protein ComFC
MKASFCPRCGRILEANTTCDNCPDEVSNFESLQYWGAFEGPLREAIHKMKYGNDIGLGEIFSEMLVQHLQQLNWSIDLIVPVPLSPGRIKERGYNQSDLLAHPVASRLKTPYSIDTLKRTRETQSQVGLSAKERQKNVTGAFWADEKKVQNKRILVIDDVMTTGATLNACAQALKEANAEQVYGLTLAKAIQQ